MHELTPGWEIK